MSQPNPSARPFGLLSIEQSAQLLGLSVHQMYRLAAKPPVGFPPPIARDKRERLRFSSVLLEAWLGGADVSSGALPQFQDHSWVAAAAAAAAAQPVKRGRGRPRNTPAADHA